jgi:hypothetical protein
MVFENNKPLVIDEFREGRFDDVELASDVAETKFFQFLFSQDVVDKLAAHYPSPRKRHYVPMWMYLSSQVSLRLHGTHSFHSYPWVIRSGGLIDALGPAVAQRHVEPETGNLQLECQGFNERNLFPRQTPCDQDYLRKLARDTEAEKLEEWYNRHVASLYAELKAYDEEGIFLADGSYLFVPDNENYEGSLRLLFDEHNHPVSKKQEQEMTKAQRDRCRWRGCYKAVFLLHCDAAGERFVVVGVRVLRGKESEATAPWPLVENFLANVGRGVMKVLVLAPRVHQRREDRPFEAEARHRHRDSHSLRHGHPRGRARPEATAHAVGRVRTAAPPVAAEFAPAASAPPDGRPT